MSANGKQTQKKSENQKSLFTPTLTPPTFFHPNFNQAAQHQQNFNQAAQHQQNQQQNQQQQNQQQKQSLLYLNHGPSRTGKKKVDNHQVAQFISATVYYLLYSYSADQNNVVVLSFQNYIKSLLACTENNVTAPVILTSLLFVSRYVSCMKMYGPIEQESEVKIWTTALMLADAAMNDSAYATKSWAQVTKIPLAECIQMRRVFLEVVNYDLHVTESQYSSWINALQQINAHVSSILYYKAQCASPCSRSLPFYPPQTPSLYPAVQQQQPSSICPPSRILLSNNANEPIVLPSPPPYYHPNMASFYAPPSLPRPSSSLSWS